MLTNAKKYSYTYKYHGVDYKPPTSILFAVGGLALVGAFAYFNWGTIQQTFQGIINDIPKL